MDLIIKDYLYKNGIRKAHVAKILGYNPQNFGPKLNLSDLTVSFVAQICIALNHDFFQDYANEIGLYKQIPKAYKQSPEVIDIVNELKEEFKQLREDLKSDQDKIQELKKSRKISSNKH